MNKSWLDNSGFTLMEILLAISIFAAVVSMAYGSYNATFRVIDSAESQAKIYEKSRVVMGLLVNDLQLLYQGKGGILQGTEDTLSGERADSLIFSSNGHIKFDRDDIVSGYALIAYQAIAGENEEDGLSLYRYDKVFLPGSKEKEEDDLGLKICDGLSGLSFQYFDDSGESFDEWNSEEPEDTANTFPSMVQITVRFMSAEDPETDIIFKTGVAIEIAEGQK